jgi:hypothetical protein
MPPICSSSGHEGEFVPGLKQSEYAHEIGSGVPFGQYVIGRGIRVEGRNLFSRSVPFVCV